MTKVRSVLMDEWNGLTRMVVLEDGIPVELAFEQPDNRPLVGNVYLARVINVLNGMNAAFVDIGLEKNAFLPLNDIPVVAAGFDDQVSQKKVSLRPGQEILVQVLKEPGGDKGPRVTMNPSFPGKWAVLLPTVQAIGVSRHIQTPAKREALMKIARAGCPPDMGLVIRTQAEEARDEDILTEVDILVERWNMIAGHARFRKAPDLLEEAGNLSTRAERDLGATPEIGAIDAALAAKLDKLLRRKVWLDSGAFLVVDPCEAMTVIDVNSGKNVGGKKPGSLMLRVNLEAAKEVARQVRLRDMGGIIVVDFVDMETDEDRETVLEAFRKASEGDRAKRHIHGFSPAGLLEMTRRPVYQSVQEAGACPCPHCRGTGAVIASMEGGASPCDRCRP